MLLWFSTVTHNRTADKALGVRILGKQASWVTPQTSPLQDQDPFIHKISHTKITLLPAGETSKLPALWNEVTIDYVECSNKKDVEPLARTWWSWLYFESSADGGYRSGVDVDRQAGWFRDAFVSDWDSGISEAETSFWEMLLFPNACSVWESEWRPNILRRQLCSRVTSPLGTRGSFFSSPGCSEMSTYHLSLITVGY
jgi:hypothetical protein